MMASGSRRSLPSADANSKGKEKNPMLLARAAVIVLKCRRMAKLQESPPTRVAANGGQSSTGTGSNERRKTDATTKSQLTLHGPDWNENLVSISDLGHYTGEGEFLIALAHTQREVDIASSMAENGGLYQTRAKSLFPSGGTARCFLPGRLQRPFSTAPYRYRRSRQVDRRNPSRSMRPTRRLCELSW